MPSMCIIPDTHTLRAFAQFQRYDTDRSGTIDERELGQALRYAHRRSRARFAVSMKERGVFGVALSATLLLMFNWSSAICPQHAADLVATQGSWHGRACAHDSKSDN